MLVPKFQRSFSRHAASTQPLHPVDMKFLSMPCDPKITPKETWNFGRSLLYPVQFCGTVLTNESSIPHPAILSGFQNGIHRTRKP